MKRDSKGFLFKFKFIPSYSNNNKKKKINQNVADFFDNGIFECIQCVKEPRSHGYCRPRRVLERVYSYLATPPPPHQPSPWWQAIQKAGKINEVSRTGTKGRHRAQGFGGMGINHIMGGNSTPGSLVPGGRDVWRQLATSLQTDRCKTCAITPLIAVFVSSGLQGRASSQCDWRS